MAHERNDFEILEKSKDEKAEKVIKSSSCCSVPASALTCCTPSVTPGENNGACCAQPGDGSACCDKN